MKKSKPTKRRSNSSRRREKRRSRIAPEVLDELLKDYASPEDLVAANGLLRELTAALVGRAMDAEMTHHLGYDRGESPRRSRATGATG